MRARGLLLPLSLAGTFLLVGCQAILGLDEPKPRQTGTGGAATSSTTGTEVTTSSSSTMTGMGGSSSSSGSGSGSVGAGGCDLSACPKPAKECVEATCSGLAGCGTKNVPDQTPVAMQIAGDCKSVVCDGSGASKVIADPNDAPIPATACIKGSCNGMNPVTTSAAVETPCADLGGKVCNGLGTCVECVVSADCKNVACQSNVCQPGSCFDGKENGNETGIDCGGSCMPCADGLGCKIPADCVNLSCTAMKCAAPTCSDGVKNGGESDTDCGAVCPMAKCGDLKACTTPADCQNGVCTNKQCPLPTCSDGVKNGGELGTDCGGSCTPCPTVLILAATSGNPGIMGGDYHPGGTWTTSMLAATTTDGVALTITTSMGQQGVGLLRALSPADQLLYTTWTAGNWSAPANVGPAITTSTQPSISSESGVAQAAFRGVNASHYYMAYTFPTWAPMPADQVPLTSNEPSAPDIVARADNATLAYAGASVVTVYDRNAGAWSIGQTAGTNANSNITPALVAMTTAAPDRMALFVTPGTTQIMFVTRSNGGWSVPAPVKSAFTADRMALLALPSGKALLAFRGNDLNLYTTTYTAGVWTAPASIGMSNISILNAPALARGVGTADVEMAYVSGGQAFHARHIGNAWTSGVQVGQVSNVHHVAIASAP